MRRVSSPTMVAALMVLLFSTGRSQDTISPPEREWGEQVGAFRLSIASDRKVYSSGEPVLILVALKNVSDDYAKVVRLEGRYPFESYDADVKVPSPSWLPFSPRALLTPLGRTPKLPLVGGMRSFPIAPGRELIDKFELNAFYEMSAVGEYRVVFSCKSPVKRDELKLPAIVSNELRIMITDAQK